MQSALCLRAFLLCGLNQRQKQGFECEMAITGPCFNTWSPVGGTALGRLWNHQEWSLARRTGSRGWGEPWGLRPDSAVRTLSTSWSAGHEPCAPADTIKRRSCGPAFPIVADHALILFSLTLISAGCLVTATRSITSTDLQQLCLYQTQRLFLFFFPDQSNTAAVHCVRYY